MELCKNNYESPYSEETLHGSSGEIHNKKPICKVKTANRKDLSFEFEGGS